MVPPSGLVTAPMMEIECGDYPEKVAETIAVIMDTMGRGKEYLMAMSKYILVRIKSIGN